MTEKPDLIIKTMHYRVNSTNREFGIILSGRHGFLNDFLDFLVILFGFSVIFFSIFGKIDFPCRGSGVGGSGVLEV